VTSQALSSAADILAQLAPQQAATVVVVPASMSVGTAENPALCLKKPLQLKWAKDQMAAPEVTKSVHTDIHDLWAELRANLKLNDILISEGVFEKSLAYKSAVVWHEYGHVVSGATENGNVYLVEVQNLANLIGVEPSRAVVTERAASAYKKALNPGRAALSTFVSTTWGITI
jgi:hypothetical protein